MQKKSFALRELYISDRTCIFSLHSLEVKDCPIPPVQSCPVSKEQQVQRFQQNLRTNYGCGRFAQNISTYLPTKLYSVYSEDCMLKITADSYCGEGNTDEREQGGEICGVMMFVLWTILEACVAEVGHVLYFELSLVKQIFQI